MLQVFKPQMGDEEIAAVAEVLRSGWIGLGPRTQEFEQRFAAYIGASRAIGLNSCTAALDLAMRLLDIHKGDEVLLPSMTFVSTAHAVAYNDATPIFCEVNDADLCIDLDDAANRITRRTRAMIVVHYGGRMLEPARLEAFARTHGITIIEDCAHAAGASYDGRMAGTIGKLGAFSFHAVKNLAMGDGGALTTSDAALADRARRLRWLGIDKGTWDRTANDRSYWWEYHVDEIGLKCHMNDIAAAIGLVQLAKLDASNARRRAIAHRYRDGLVDVQQVQPALPDDEHSRSAWHLFHILAEDRDALSVHLKEQDIATGVHYKPIHLYRCYGNRPSLPRSEALFGRLLTLPSYPDLTDADVDRVIDAIRTFYKMDRRSRPPAQLPAVTLRPVAESDLERLRAWRNDPEIRPFLFDDSEITPAGQRAWWERYQADDADFLFVIETAAGAAVGTVGLAHVDARHATATLGRCMLGAASHRGQGLLTAAVLTLCRRAFGPMGLRRLELEVLAENERSAILYRRCGFRLEGTRRGAKVVRGQPRDVLSMALLASEFTGQVAEPGE